MNWLPMVSLIWTHYQAISRDFICRKLLETRQQEDKLNSRQKQELYFFLEICSEQDRLPEFEFPAMEKDFWQIFIRPYSIIATACFKPAYSPYWVWIFIPIKRTNNATMVWGRFFKAWSEKTSAFTVVWEIFHLEAEDCRNRNIWWIFPLWIQRTQWFQRICAGK